jgi:hypothetical protein
MLNLYSCTGVNVEMHVQNSRESLTTMHNILQNAEFVFMRRSRRRDARPHSRELQTMMPPRRRITGRWPCRDAVPVDPVAAAHRQRRRTPLTSRRRRRTPLTPSHAGPVTTLSLSTLSPRHNASAVTRHAANKPHTPLTRHCSDAVARRRPTQSHCGRPHAANAVAGRRRRRTPLV